jgi:hypothetical protein
MHFVVGEEDPEIFVSISDVSIVMPTPVSITNMRIVLTPPESCNFVFCSTKR